MTNEEAFRYHRAHCSGCSEYAYHMGASGRPKTVLAAMPFPYRKQYGFDTQAVKGDAGFDSPPPPSLTDDLTLLMRLRKMYGPDFTP